MANGKLTLSDEGFERLSRVMSELNVLNKKLEDSPSIIRPETLKLAFAKGISSLSGPQELIKRKPSKFTIGEGVIARGDDYLLIKHLLVDKLNLPVQELNDKMVDDHILHYVEAGLEIMDKEISSLNELDNYLLWLVDNLNKPT